MSIVEIDSKTWNAVFNATVAQQIDLGFDLPAARQMAKDQMDLCFVKRELAFIREADADAREETEGDWTR